jgi:hypothetical protein
LGVTSIEVTALPGSVASFEQAAPSAAAARRAVFEEIRIQAGGKEGQE